MHDLHRLLADHVRPEESVGIACDDHNHMLVGRHVVPRCLSEPGSLNHSPTNSGCTVSSATFSISAVRRSRSVSSRGGAENRQHFRRVVLAPVEALIDKGLDAAAQREE